MNKTILIGEFNSEKYWKDEGYAKLPEIPDKNSYNIIRSMDELLFPLAKSKDLLITRYKFNSFLKDYLESIGFDFLCTNKNVETVEDINDNSIFEVLYKNKNLFNDIFPYDVKDRSLEPYSIMKYCKNLAYSLNLKYNGCDYKIVKNVNSKVYSQNLSKILNLKYYGEIISSHEELVLLSNEAKFNNGLLIKDPYGVSGKGNMLLNSKVLINRIAKYLKAQEDKGLKTLFVVEPFLQKEIDFSCGLNISKEGKIKIISVQKMINSNFAYLGSITADKDFVDYLYRNNYFYTIEKIADKLHEDGYFGDVCIDSMILANGDIVPIIEINCRKSMGFINYYLDQYLKRYNLKGSLCFLNLGYKKDLTFEILFEALKSKGLIFYSNLTTGLIPISSNTMFINRDLDISPKEEKIYKGRFYMCIVSSDSEERENILDKVKKTLYELSVQIYN
ncbi:hypothetical protein SAMN02745163_00432 [Clostridium cavendishii DSM 21758]|uniref:ATP-grasp domain-containing protein n=1 Tax=Clostridium cavendishii DSM 21758 TaxID=1121302 RepID=A0A1M6CD82_9CLOT|nr:hypothetical protein [Clostridium cavendishii]SHI58668.1 hypothetical protein SAMN02745163_00432 [Clostridium cavendishii DSM 21758]